MNLLSQKNGRLQQSIVATYQYLLQSNFSECVARKLIAGHLGIQPHFHRASWCKVFGQALISSFRHLSLILYRNNNVKLKLNIKVWWVCCSTLLHVGGANMRTRVDIGIQIPPPPCIIGYWISPRKIGLHLTSTALNQNKWIIIIEAHYFRRIFKCMKNEVAFFTVTT